MVLVFNSVFANKILCLHGGGGNATTFQYLEGMQDLIEALPKWQFIFASSPVSGGVWYDDPPGDNKEPTCCPNWADTSINYLNNFIDANGPFDAILGYSQGVPMSLIYLASGNHNISHILLFNGYLPTTHPGLMCIIDNNAPYFETTLIFLATNDRFYQIGLDVKNKFASYTELVSTNAGHALPTASDMHFKSVVDFLKDARSSECDTDHVRSFRPNHLSSNNLKNLEKINTGSIITSAQNQSLKQNKYPNSK